MDIQFNCTTASQPLNILYIYISKTDCCIAGIPIDRVLHLTLVLPQQPCKILQGETLSLCITQITMVTGNPGWFLQGQCMSVCTRYSVDHWYLADPATYTRAYISNVIHTWHSVGIFFLMWYLHFSPKSWSTDGSIFWKEYLRSIHFTPFCPFLW